MLFMFLRVIGVVARAIGRDGACKLRRLKRLQLSHPDGRVTFEDYVKALKAEGVSGAERFAAEYPRPETKS